MSGIGCTLVSSSRTYAVVKGGCATGKGHTRSGPPWPVRRPVRQIWWYPLALQLNRRRRSTLIRDHLALASSLVARRRPSHNDGPGSPATLTVMTTSTDVLPVGSTTAGGGLAELGKHVPGHR